MPTLDKDTVRQTATVAAPAQLVFGLVAEVQNWYQFHDQSVHAEPVGRQGGTERFRHWWVTDAHTVRTWEGRWHFDRAAGRISYEFDPAEPGTAGLRGTWVFQSASDSATEVLVEQDPWREGAYDASRAELDLRGLLGSVASAAEHDAERRDLMVDFEDPLFAAGSLDDAYAFLYEADKWPERIPHVSRLVLQENVPNIQFFDMDTAAPDGSAHTTRSVRICLPGDKIVYKQIKLPALLNGHSGHWKFTPTREGFILAARHTASIKRSALSILGPQTSVLDARKYVRRVLSANSMSNLRLAKAYAEERAGV